MYRATGSDARRLHGTAACVMRSCLARRACITRPCVHLSNMVACVWAGLGRFGLCRRVQQRWTIVAADLGLLSRPADPKGSPGTTSVGLTQRLPKPCCYTAIHTHIHNQEHSSLLPSLNTADAFLGGRPGWSPAAVLGLSTQHTHRRYCMHTSVLLPSCPSLPYSPFTTLHSRLVF